MKIYDEALKELQEVIGEYGMDYYTDKHFPITIKAIKRAKKEHELVVIYSNVPFTMISHLFRDEDIQRIDELEKELEESK